MDIGLRFQNAGCVFKWCPDILVGCARDERHVPTHATMFKDKKDVPVAYWRGTYRWRNDLLLDMLPSRVHAHPGEPWLRSIKGSTRMVEFDGKLQFDAYRDVCPICAEIVETEVWPKIVEECGEHLSAPEVVRGEKPPPCPICNHNELEMDWITMSTKDNKGFVHNMYISCPSCGAGMRREKVQMPFLENLKSKFQCPQRDI